MFPQSLKACLAIAFLFAQTQAQAGTTPTYTTIHQTTVAPSHIKASNGQFFDASPKGLRKYFEEILRGENGEVYGQMTAELENLEIRQKMTWPVMMGGLAIGALCMFGSLGEEQFYDEFTRTYETRTAISYPMLMLGGALMVLGPIAGLAMQPSRTTLMDFVNKHNRLNNRTNLEFQMGMDGRRRDVDVRLSMKF